MKKILSLVTVLAVVLAAPGCSWFKKASTTTETALIDCAKTVEHQAAINGGLANAILTIAGEFILAVQSGDYTSTVAGLVSEYGVPLVACTIHALEQQANPAAPADAGSGSAMPATAEQDPFATAAHDVIVSNGWQFK